MNGFGLDVLANLLGTLPVIGVVLAFMWWRQNAADERANRRWHTHHEQHVHIQHDITDSKEDVARIEGRLGAL